MEVTLCSIYLVVVAGVVREEAAVARAVAGAVEAEAQSLAPGRLATASALSASTRHRMWLASVALTWSVRSAGPR